MDEMRRAIGRDIKMLRGWVKTESKIPVDIGEFGKQPIATVWGKGRSEIISVFCPSKFNVPPREAKWTWSVGARKISKFGLPSETQYFKEFTTKREAMQYVRKLMMRFEKGKMSLARWGI